MSALDIAINCLRHMGLHPNGAPSSQELGDAATDELAQLRTDLADSTAQLELDNDECLYLRTALDKARKEIEKSCEWFAQYPFGNKAFEGNSATGRYYELTTWLEKYPKETE